MGASSVGHAGFDEPKKPWNVIDGGYTEAKGELRFRVSKSRQEFLALLHAIHGYV